MNLLLDTHSLVWWLEKNPRLGRRALDAIADPDNRVWVSAATIWEIAIKVGLGRLDLGEPPEICLPREIAASAFRTLDITPRHALAVASLPSHHRDPFDRLLIAQAGLEVLTIVTVDQMLESYDIDLLRADL